MRGSMAARLLVAMLIALVLAQGAMSSSGREASANSAASTSALLFRGGRRGLKAVSPCADSQTFFNPGSGTCVATRAGCTNGGYGFDSPTHNTELDWKCLDSCPPNAGPSGDGFPYNTVYTIATTKNCVIGPRTGNPCSGGLKVDFETSSCVATCPAARPAATTDGVCVGVDASGVPSHCCYGLDRYDEEGNYGCPGTPYVYDRKAARCTQSCSAGQYANAASKTCIGGDECVAQGKFLDTSGGNPVCVNEGGCLSENGWLTDRYSRTCVEDCNYIDGLDYCGSSCCQIVPNTPPEFYLLNGFQSNCGTGYTWTYKFKLFDTARQFRTSDPSQSFSAGVYSGYDRATRTLMYTGGDEVGSSSPRPRRSTNVTLHCAPWKANICGEPGGSGGHYEIHQFMPEACVGTGGWSGTSPPAPPAPKTYTKMPAGFDYPNNDMYKAIMPKCGTTRTNCQALCDSTPGCVMYVYGTPSWGKDCCALKSAVSKAKAEPGLTAYKAV